jgi:putative hemolysin
MVEQVLEHLNIRCTVSARDLEQIPEHGPLVIIANHPTGTLDGLALLYAVSRVRRDVKVVTNRMLTHLEPLSSLFIPVDNMGGRPPNGAGADGPAAAKRRRADLLPGGEVSRPTRKGIRDKKWHSGFIKLAANARPAAAGMDSGAQQRAVLRQHAGLRQPAAAAADAADVPPPPQQPAD